MAVQIYGDCDEEGFALFAANMHKEFMAALMAFSNERGFNPARSSATLFYCGLTYSSFAAVDGDLGREEFVRQAVAGFDKAVMFSNGFHPDQKAN